MIAGRFHWKGEAAKIPAKVGLAALDMLSATLLVGARSKTRPHGQTSSSAGLTKIPADQARRTPGVAESIDRAMRLMVLHTDHLEQQTIRKAWVWST